MRVRPITDAQAQRFKQLAWPLLPVVLRTAQVLTRQPDQAEDLAQETMVKAMRAIDSYQDNTDIRAWLLTILRRTHIDRMRAEQRKPNELPLDESAVGGLPGDPQHANENDQKWEQPEDLLNRFEDEAVIEAMRSLPEDIRWTLLLIDVEQLGQAEAAEVLGVATGTIKSRAHRGRAMLRNQLYQLAVQRGWVCHEEQSS